MSDDFARYEDEELADIAAMCTDLLRGIAARWQAREQAGRLAGHPRAEVLRLIQSLQAGARVVEDARSAEATGDVAEMREAIERLRRSEERMRLMVEVVSDYAIFMLDPEGRVASWNTGAQRLKGYRADEIIGRHFSTFYTEPDRRRGHPDEELRRAVAEGKYEEEGWRVRKDGSVFWANVVITAVWDSSRKLIGFTKVTRDLTDRRAAEERLRQSEERLRLMVESVKDYAIFMLDPHGRVSTWNPGAERLKGYTAQEIIGQHFSRFYTEVDRARHHPEDELRRAESEGRYEEEGWRVRKTGEQFWANVVITPVYDPKHQLVGFAKVTRDLTERRRMEQEALAAERAAAESRVREQQATEAVRMRDEFISVASHELRTPLTALQLKLENVVHNLSKATASLDEGDLSKQVERVDGALRQSQRLGDLVERLLDVSQIIAGKLAITAAEMDLGALVAEVAEDLRTPAQAAGSELRLRIAEGVRGKWDRARLGQVLTNLINNAIKYGRAKPIDVSVEALPSGARLVVADHGIGIAPQDVDRIFGRFERAVSAEHYGGLGLGLYVARNIIEAHGGSIQVTSAMGEGSTFTIELPWRRGAATP